VYVVMVTPECAPAAKAGGLGDMVSGLSRELELRDTRNGFVFHHTDHRAIESALGRALRLWSVRPRDFRRLAANCMRADYSWAGPGREYLDIYQHIRHK
jgi:glycogen synthase